MKKKEVIVLVLILVVLAMPAYAIPGPDALYCAEMRHEYSMTEHGDGGQTGICDVDGVQCDAWDFYKGKCEPDKSVCAVLGYDTVTVNGSSDPFTPEYALCAVKTSNEITGNAVLNGGGSNILIKLIRWLASYMITGHAVAEDAAEEIQGIPAIELTGINQKISEYTVPDVEPDTVPHEAEMQTASAPGPMAPTSFDWRNYNGYNWMTSVKNQGSCGSCWAFSAVGSIEAKQNIQHNNPSLDPNLAEEYVVSDCLSNSIYDTCCGGYNTDVFQYVRDSGITDESCFPYSESCDCPALCGASCTYSTLIPFACSDWTCSNRCGTWSSRLWTISSYTYSSLPSDATIKQYVYDYGPLSICLGISSDYGGYWDGDIYRCSDDSGTNHCVVLVGYNDSGGYWIIKNSWGSTWNGDGYYKLGYGECHVSKIAFASSVNTAYPTVSLSSPTSGVWTNANPVSFTFSVNTAVASTATCQLIVGGTVRATNSSTQDSVSTTLTASLSDGTYTWNVSCWENGIGAIDDSTSRTINVDRTAPTLTIYGPQQTVYASSSIMLNYSATDPRLSGCWFTNTTGKNQTLTGCLDYMMNGIADGNHTITLYANDSVGNMNSLQRKFAVDLLPPTVNFTSPTPADLTSTATVTHTINVTANDTVGPVSACTLEFNGQNTTMTKTGTGTNVTCRYNKTIIGSGTFTYRVYANDSVGRIGASQTRQLTILNTPPTITGHYPSSAEHSIAEPADQEFNITHSDVNGDTVSVRWYLNGTPADTDNNLIFTGSYTSAGEYNITAVVNDSKDTSRFTWNLTVNNTNRPPEAQSVGIASSDISNRTNGTLTGSWSYYDIDGDPYTDNETRWYNNTAEVAALRNTTSVSSEYTRRLENWTFSVRVYDGQNWSVWQNSTRLEVQNIPPELDTIADITINESEWANMTASATDEDTLTYAINDTRFTQAGSKFSWKTTLTDAGHYTVRVNVTDGIAADQQEIIVMVMDAPDFDDDGEPDFSDTDDDNDGIDDSSDTLTGNETKINTTLPGIRLWVNNSDNLSSSFTDRLNVNVTDADNTTLVYFSWNFSQGTLVVNWTVEYNETNASIRVSGLDLASQGLTKTVYLNKSDSAHNYVCIADDESTVWVSDDCSGHTKVSCGSSGQCIDLGDRFQISGLAHSFVKTIYVAPAPPSTGGGGGGGGGSSTARAVTIIPDADGQTVSLSRTTKANVIIDSDQLSLDVTSVGVADIMFTLGGYYYSLSLFQKEIDIDADKDARRDITVVLESISGSSATLTFRLYQEPSRPALILPANYTRTKKQAEPQQAAAPSAPATEEPAAQEPVQESPTQLRQEMKRTGMIWILISLFVLTALIIAVHQIIKRLPPPAPKPEKKPEKPVEKPAQASQLQQKKQAEQPKPKATLLHKKAVPPAAKIPLQQKPKPQAKQPAPAARKTHLQQVNDEIGQIKQRLKDMGL